jgi:RNA polymerase-binding protein DksA
MLGRSPTVRRGSRELKAESESNIAKKAAKKKAAKKAAGAKKTTLGKKSAAKTSASRKSTAKKKTDKKTAVTTKKKAAKAKAATAKKAPAKKVAKTTAAKKSATTKAVAKKAPAKKTAAKKASATKKVVAEKAPVTKKKVAKKAAPKTAPVPVELPEPPRPKLPPLSKRISKKNTDAIRKRLLERRSELLGGLQSVDARSQDHAVQAGGDEIDAATYSVAADLSLRMAESESRELKEIELALSKLEDGSYGVCEATGLAIDVRRLLFMPTARLSLEAQEQLEREQLYHDSELGWVRTDF